MKPFLAAFLLLSTAVILEAGETPPVLRKFRLVYTDAAHQLAEAEVQSISDKGTTVLPLRLPSKSMWICWVTVDQPENIVSFEVQSEASAGESKTPQTILSVTMPLRNGEEMVLVKSTAFTLSATVTLPAVPKEGEPAPETPSLALTEDELKKVVIKTSYKSNTELNSISIVGYNPFGRRLSDGVLRVTVPKTGDTPEVIRDYAVNLNAAGGLADFKTWVSAWLEIPKGVEPTCQLVKLNFMN